MPLSYLPGSGIFTLGTSPEVLNPFWQQFAFDGFPSGLVNMGVPTDCAVVLPITSAQLLALNTTAIQLVAPPITGAGIPSYQIPPGGGFIYTPTAMSMQYKFGGTAYTIGGTSPVFQIEYTGQTTSLLSQTPTGLVDQTTDRIVSVQLATGPILATNTVARNLGLELKLGGTTPTLTLGNGTVVLTLLYNVLALF
jgi:hypothetical protein